MSIIRSLTNRYSRRRFACLFFSLLITMVAAPVFAAKGLSTRFMEVFLALNILAAVLITLFSFGTYVGLGLLALVLVARGGHALLDYEPLLATSQGIGAVICLVSVCVMLRFILSEGSVTSERIFAALDLYLILGVMCGLLFCILEEEWPGSFSFQSLPLAESRQNPLAHTIYFSFVTLGTLGYGDIIPVGGPARALAVAEAISGQMYLVVVVARLVSLYKGGSCRNEGNEQG
ncbi:potassium channel family protein [Desulforhabdus amnigena]|uniref:Potassium channel domain-containing protein n=1 Tax=Desulforhabdus amnigena TaxID=40218 RepID=A0A9W6D402_9BACT|nr:potassium channel family protein [Desulforhabdus amnigena]NLJ26845.1 two pore domain potassium channel family protein [Deltaproteobacteria bacterium]GLI33762.1 hypothetical protein DAMNIGENAA_11950 [Desulforhabdus amnigena]